LKGLLETLNYGELKGGVTLDINKSILQTIREAVGLSSTTTDFDTELLMHINTAIGKLNQNGVGNFLVVENEDSVWKDLQNPSQTDGNQYFQMVPLFITLSTKLMFDPPPPSTVEYYQNSIHDALWRLKIAYEEPYVQPTEIGGE
jgi:hypothetical protein